jgi:hypothetical protein
MGWDVALWAVAIGSVLVFMVALGTMTDESRSSQERGRAKEAIQFDIPIWWRFAFLVVGALYAFRFWRRGLMAQFGVSDLVSWPLAIFGTVAIIVLAGAALAMPRVRWWWLVALWLTAAGSVWFFCWVVSRGGFVPMNEG